MKHYYYYSSEPFVEMDIMEVMEELVDNIERIAEVCK